MMDGTIPHGEVLKLLWDTVMFTATGIFLSQSGRHRTSSPAASTCLHMGWLGSLRQTGWSSHKDCTALLRGRDFLAVPPPGSTGFECSLPLKCYSKMAL